MKDREGERRERERYRKQGTLTEGEGSEQFPL
jgi:hypothetical protein